MAKDTKDRILVAALKLFSQNGYEGTNIRKLSVSLTLVESAMYKHFESKEEIWNTLLDEMIIFYDTHFGSPEYFPIQHRSPPSFICATGSRRKQKKRWNRSKHSSGILSGLTG